MNKKISLLVIIAAVFTLSSCIIIDSPNYEGSLYVRNYSKKKINTICIGFEENDMRIFWNGNGSYIYYGEHKTFDLNAGTYVVSVETPYEPKGYYCYNVVIESGHTTKLAFDGDELYEY